MGSVFILLHNKFAVTVYDSFSLQSVRFLLASVEYIQLANGRSAPDFC